MTSKLRSAFVSESETREEMPIVWIQCVLKGCVSRQHLGNNVSLAYFYDIDMEFSNTVGSLLNLRCLP